jgi:hypothetical protein
MKKSFFNKYIVCVNGVCKEGDYSWVYYVNDKPMNQGLDVYQVRDGDAVKLVYGEV